MASSRQKNCCEIIPENAEFEQERLRSLGDETPSEDTANDKETHGQPEQEEISRKRK